MADEAKINVATGFNGGVSVSLRANSAAEFEQLLADAVTSPNLVRLLQAGGLAATDAQAVATVQQTFPGAQVVNQPVSTVGQPLPVPQPASAQQAQQARIIPGPAGAPPGVAYPGDCIHGPRVYTDKQARGKAWRRWECFIPWSRNAVGRCDAVNVDG